MLTIVLLSNSNKAISGLKSIIELYMYEKMFPIDIKVCKEIKDILKLNIPNAIIFITDSKERNAVKTAQILREHHHTEALVLISDNIELVYEAFKVSAYRVLKAPVANSDIFEVIDSFRKRALSKHVVVVKDGAETISLAMSDITYIASINREAKIYTKHGEINATVPLFQIAAQLPTEFFHMCHRSYIVNLMNIRSVSTTIDRITLIDGTVLPISRRRKSEFVGAREKFMQNHTYTIIN